MLSLLSLSIERALHARSVEHVRVIVRIDGVDVSHADGDDGPNPWDALVPVNRFVATDDFTTATISCCPSCGPACCAVQARVRREGDVVRWELGDRRGVRGVAERRTILFDAAAYDAEPDEYQIWVHAPWDTQRPDDSAAAVRAMLTGPAADWPARWHSVKSDREDPPVYAGPSWQRATL